MSHCTEVLDLSWLSFADAYAIVSRRYALRRRTFPCKTRDEWDFVAWAELRWSFVAWERCGVCPISHMMNIIRLMRSPRLFEHPVDLCIAHALRRCEVLNRNYVRAALGLLPYSSK
jgi:hypothetical protein